MSLFDYSESDHWTNTLEIDDCVDADPSKPLTALGTEVAEGFNWGILLVVQ